MAQGVAHPIPALAYPFTQGVAGQVEVAGTRQVIGGARAGAVQHLLAYADSGQAADHAAFEASLRVPDGDRAAREAMNRRPADWERARAGYVYRKPVWSQRGGQWYYTAGRWDRVQCVTQFG